MNTKITKEQEEQIINLYTTQNLSYEKTAEMVKCSIYMVRKVLKDAGIKGKRSRKKEFSKEQLDYIFDLYLNQKKSIHDIVAIVHSSTETIRRILGDYIRPTGTPKKYTVNSNYFDNIDTEHKAYWLGVFYADGNITKEGETKSIRFNSIDNNWLDLFIQDIEFSGLYKEEVHKKYNKVIYCLRINDNKLHDSLNNWGCVPQKTKIIKFPNFLSEELVPHFIRGYFDGDGTVGVYKNSSKSNIYTLRSGFCTGSEEFIIELVKHLPCIYNKVKKCSTADTWSISYSVNDSIRLYNYMYNNATIFLNRKKEKFEQFVQVRRSETIISPSLSKDEGIVQTLLKDKE